MSRFDPLSVRIYQQKDVLSIKIWYKQLKEVPDRTKMIHSDQARIQRIKGPFRLEIERVRAYA
jgi:hypothetical protein